MLEDLRRQQMELVREKAARARRRRLLWGLVLVPLLALTGFLAIQIAGNRHFEITHYTLRSEKVADPFRLAVLSDLHSAEYGEDNSELVAAIREEQPDLIVMIGDMVNKDDRDFSVLYRLCGALADTAPIYYTLGNHEGSLMYSQLDAVALDERLTERGVRVLINQSAQWQKGDTTVYLAGIAVEAAGYDQWAREKLEDFWTQDGYRIVLSHFPDLYESKLRDAGFDLALAGHYHGGLICVPGIGGLYHPETGFFPAYWGGEYPLTHGTLIVSRGMGGHGLIPRINNRPELVIIDVEEE